MIFVIKSHHETDGSWSSVLAVCASRERAERFLTEEGWTRFEEPQVSHGEDYEWGRMGMEDGIVDPNNFDICDGYEGAVIISMELLD